MKNAIARLQMLWLTTSALLCLLILVTSGLWYNRYAIYYGTFGWHMPEMAFLLHYVMFGTSAILLLATALGLNWGERLMNGFDHLQSIGKSGAWVTATISSVLVFFLVTAVRIFLLNNTPITDDENVYVFMARTLALGRTHLPSLPEGIRPFFDNQFIINDGKWYGMFFPGHPAFLAIGHTFHTMRWVPAIAATLTVPLAFAVAKRIFNQRVAIFCMPLIVLSPFFILSSATLLAHSTASCLLIAFIYFILRTVDEPDHWRWWIAAALAIGVAVLTRPLSAIAFAIPWCILLGVTVNRQRKPRVLMGMGLFILVILFSVFALAAYQMGLSGNPLISGYQTYSRIYSNSFLQGALPAVNPLPSIYEFGYTVARLNFWLLGWPVSLILLPFFEKRVVGVCLFLGPLLLMLFFAALTQPSINAVGPIHYAEITVPLIILSASGFERLVQWSRNVSHLGPRMLMALPLAATICTLMTFAPVYSISLKAMANLAASPYDLVKKAGIDNAIVFVNSLGAREFSPRTWVYYHQNTSPDLQEPVMFVRDLGPKKNRNLIQNFPNRSPYWMGVYNHRLALIKGLAHP